MSAKVDAIAAEFSPNCGGSMRDSVNRIEASVHRLTQVDHIAMEMSDKAYIELDDQAHCTWANSAFAKLTGLQRHDIYDNGWINGIHPADRGVVRGEFSQAISDRRNFTIQFRLQAGGCVYLTALLVMDRSGATAGAIASIGTLDCHSCPPAWKENCRAQRK
jgi:PAS domain S-box-containing protein